MTKSIFYYKSKEQKHDLKKKKPAVNFS